jgi:hypothetical protein
MVRDAKAAARSWVEEEASRLPGFLGAYLAGSLRSRPDGDPFPASSDVDLRIVLDREIPDRILFPDNPYRQQKLSYRGVVIEPAYVPWDSFADLGAALSDMYLAPPLVDPVILSDPLGRIDGISRAVSAEHGRRSWIAKRCANAAESARGACDRVAAPSPLAVYDPLFCKITPLLLAAMNAACIPVVAALEEPTTRKSFLLSRAVLHAYGRDDLADLLLRFLGSEGMAIGEAERALAELERAYDAAASVSHTAFNMECNVSATSRELSIGGIRELLRDHHREAMFYLALIRGIAQNVLTLDADPSVRDAFLGGYGELLGMLGLGSDEAIGARVEEIRAGIPILEEASAEILSRNPKAFD